LALRKALFQMSPLDIQREVAASGLKGRGGAGFPTGEKWSYVPMGDDAPRPKYIISNSDEMEPGSFKDRFLMEGDPHRIVEGLIIGAYAIEAERAYIFLRWSYLESAARLERAIEGAYRKGYLGKNIMGSSFSLEMKIHTSAGRYICGEETALLNALEGKRGIPRAKPPFPQVLGLWGRPTVVNNAETLANIPLIVAGGSAWFQGLSLCDEGGTKIYGVSGRVNAPGSWELPMGTPIGEIVEEYAGGMKPGFKLRGIIPGGASTDFLLPEHLAIPMDFASCERAGSRLGTGTMIILDDKTCPVGMVLNMVRFFARESCGWCTPCREGLNWLVQLLTALEGGKGRTEDLEIMEEHCRLLGPGHTFCALAPGAVEPLQSALRFFREDFERHIKEGRCPWR
ncbi:MAG: NADH-quinone oxidoreductase subunit NuoF, partial [Smithellaceae bacterium]|nr:NADH-quinone oxidoreductase subunit NuoF [Smithellaceae bacterium]